MSGHAVAWQTVAFAYPGGPEVVCDVTLSVGPGEAVALLGPNGAGKTTLTRMIMGLVRPARGTVQVGDWDVARRRPDEMARRAGYVFQHADQQLFARSVFDDVAFGPRQLGQGDGAVMATLDELALADVARTNPWDLPAPLRKLAALAGVLAMRPGLLVLDEPTAGFDRELRAVVVAALRKRLKDGVTIVAISHDLDFVSQLATRTVTLEAGRVSADRQVTPSPGAG